jgi:hypothetical protein
MASVSIASRDGLASVGREGIKNWSGIISPHEMTEELQTTFSAPSADDYDGVEVFHQAAHADLIGAVRVKHPIEGITLNFPRCGVILRTGPALSARMK